MTSTLYGIFLGAFFASTLLGPWWVAVILAIFPLAYGNGYIPVIMGGVMRDTLYGVPSPLLYDFSLLFTTAFVIAALFTVYLRSRILE